MQNWYHEIYKALLKERQDLNKRRDVICSWIGRLNIVNIVSSPRLMIRRPETIPIKIPAIFRNGQGYFKMFGDAGDLEDRQ